MPPDEVAPETARQAAPDAPDAAPISKLDTEKRGAESPAQSMPAPRRHGGAIPE
jgi:hypothetical protein